MIDRFFFIETTSSEIEKQLNSWKYKFLTVSIHGVIINLANTFKVKHFFSWRLNWWFKSSIFLERKWIWVVREGVTVTFKFQWFLLSALCPSVCPSVGRATTNLHGVNRLGRFMARLIAYDPKIRTMEIFFLDRSWTRWQGSEA